MTFAATGHLPFEDQDPPLRTQPRAGLLPGRQLSNLQTARLGIIGRDRTGADRQDVKICPLEISAAFFVMSINTPAS